MEKKVVVALALSLFILVGFQFVMARLYPPSSRMNTNPGSVSPPQPQAVTEGALPTTNEQVQEVAEEMPPVFADEKEILFKNKLYTVVFSDIGAGIKKITLNENPKDGLYISYDVFNAKNPSDSLLLFFPDKFGASLNNEKYDSQVNNNAVIFTYKFNDEFLVEKRYIFDNSLYRIDLELTFKNLKGEDITKKYLLISGAHIPSSAEEEKSLEISTDLNGKIWKDKKQSKPFETQRGGTLNWTMFKNRYFLMILKPLVPSEGYVIKQNKNGAIISAVNIQEFIIPANSSATHKFGAYIGPSSSGLLNNTNLGIENAFNAGFFGSISQLLVSSLRFFHRIFRNWGVAIIVLSIVMNVALMPLTRKSYQSMHEMQALQPKIEKLKQEHKNNPQKLQKEIMEVYKKHKINPMGGCLPMLLQMPIFIALYQGLMGSIELRGAKFLWVKDLSVPENIPIPFNLPLIGSTINILPILMLVAMFFQQKLSNKMTAMTQTEEQKQQQKMMTIMMTAMFGFIFWSFPSGLVLYWLCNTAVMIVYQIISTRTPKPIEEHV